MSGLKGDIVINRPDGFRLELEIEIMPGTTVALVGPNGAGKSTAVHALAGLVPIDSGRIELNHTILDDPSENMFVPPERRRVGVVFQEYLLFPHLSVIDNIAFGPRSTGQSKEASRETALRLLETFDMVELADRKSTELSGGQAQRVALARALVTEPQMLLMDEPMAALDSSGRVEVRRALSDVLGVFAGPRLLITHDPAEAFLLADRVYVIESGQVTQVGSPEEVRIKPRTAYVADLAGSNLLFGTANHGEVRVGHHVLHSATTDLSGEVIATVHPRAISVHLNLPEGSPRNVWETEVTRLEHYGDRVRLQTVSPVALTVELTPGSVEALDIRPGMKVWLSIKATEIYIEPR